MIKFAIIGAGTIANKMAYTVSRMGTVEPYAVAARDLGRAKAFADEYGFKKAYGSYDEMLQDKEVDLVYVAVPHSLHYKTVKLCLENGKNVLCEKPFTVSADQAKKLVALAEEKKLLIAEAMWTRYMPSRKIIDDIIASGQIGEVTSLTANIGYELTGVKRLWDPALAGGAILDCGCYLVHFARMVFGCNVTALSASAVFRNGVDAIDTVSMTFDGTKLATMQTNVMAAQDRQGTIFGTKGYIVVTNINNPEAVDVYDADYKKTASYPVPAQITGFEYEVSACCKALEEGKTECEELPLAEIVACLETLDEIRGQIGLESPILE